MTRRGAGQRARPLPDAVGRDDTELEPTVVGTGVLECRDASEELADVADQHTARLAVEPLLVVDAYPQTCTRRAEVLCAGEHVREPAGTILEAAVGVTDHQRVEARARHHR